MKKVMILSALLLSSSAFADERAEIMANNCAGCHGTDGVVENSALISIAGLKADVFIQTMNDFRSNERSSTIMRNVALALTDDEISAMAQYFETLPTGEEK